MTRIRGFSLLEIMLALIVVGIGISVVLTFSASSRQETSSQAGGNDYSVITNDILQKLVNEDIKTCNKNVPNGSCPLNTQFASIKEMTAYDYLCGNTTNSTGTTSLTCANGNILDSQYTALKNAGLDLLTTTVKLKPSESDI